MLATCDAYRAHRHRSESPYPGQFINEIHTRNRTLANDASAAHFGCHAGADTRLLSPSLSLYCRLSCHHPACRIRPAEIRPTRSARLGPPLRPHYEAAVRPHYEAPVKPPAARWSVAQLEAPLAQLGGSVARPSHRRRPLLFVLSLLPPFRDDLLASDFLLGLRQSEG